MSRKPSQSNSDRSSKRYRVKDRLDPGERHRFETNSGAAISGEFDPIDAVRVFINNNEINPLSMSDNNHELVLDGHDEAQNIEYEFSVSAGGQIVQHDNGPASINKEDWVADDGRSAGGAIFAGVDAFYFSGEIDHFEIADASVVDIILDGEEVSVDDLNPKEPEPEPEPEQPEEPEPEPEPEPDPEDPGDQIKITFRCDDDHENAVYYISLAEGQTFDPLDSFGVEDFDRHDQLHHGGRSAFGEVGGPGRDELMMPAEFEIRGLMVSEGAVIEIGGEIIDRSEFAGSEKTLHSWGLDPELETRDMLEHLRAVNQGREPVLRGNDQKPPLPDDLETDGPTGPDPEYAEKYDHYVEINGTQWDEAIRYHLVTTGEIVPASTGDSVDNWGHFGHAEGRAYGFRDGYYFDGSLLNVFAGPMSLGRWRRSQGDNSLEWDDLPYQVLVDGEPVNHDAFDPRTDEAGSPIDLPIGYRPDALSESLSPTEKSADHVIRDWDDLNRLDDRDLSPGDIIFIAEDVQGPPVNGVVKNFNTDSITLASDSESVLHTDEEPGSRWANIFLRFGGKHVTLINLRLRGSCDRPRPYSGGAAMGVNLDGAYPVVLNCYFSQFGQHNLRAGGPGMTAYCVDSFDAQVKGSGYAIASSGPANVGAWDELEYNKSQPWQERASVKFCRLDGCRHSLERGSNAAMESRHYVIGPKSKWNGAQDDTHRFARGEEARTDRVLMNADDVVVNDWWRGRPFCVRIGRTWYEGREEGRWDKQTDPRTAERNPGGSDDTEPIAQRVARAPWYRDRDVGWEKSNGPFVPHPEREVEGADPDPHAWQFDTGTLQIGGTKPEFITDELYTAVKFMRDER